MEENCFTVLGWGLSYISMNQSQVTRMSPPSWSSLPPPTQSHSSGLSQSTGFSSWPYTANSHWLSVLQMIMHMFQCYCLSLSHPLLPCGVEEWFLRGEKHMSCKLSKNCSCSVTKSCPTLCDPMNCSMTDFPVPHHLPEFAQAHVHWCHPTISSPIVPFSCPQSFPASGSFSNESALRIGRPKY